MFPLQPASLPVFWCWISSPLDLGLCSCLFLGEAVWRCSDAVLVVVMCGGNAVVVVMRGGGEACCVDVWWWWLG